MTVLEALTRLHALLEGDTQVPTSGDDYSLRLEFLNDATEEWGNQSDTRWRELYTTDESNTGDGSTTRFSLPDDFHSFNGDVYFSGTDGTDTSQIVTTARGRRQPDKGRNFCWIEGDELVFSAAPGDGVTISLPYYATPTKLTTNSQRLPMSNPRYAIYYALARLIENSGDLTRYNTNMQKAEDLLLQMKINNDSLGEGVPNQVQFVSPGFGE